MYIATSFCAELQKEKMEKKIGSQGLQVGKA